MSMIPSFDLFGSNDETGEDRLKRRIYRAVEPEAIRAAKAEAELSVIKAQGARVREKADNINELAEALETVTGVKLQDFPVKWRVKLYFEPELTREEMEQLINDVMPKDVMPKDDSKVG